MNYSKSLKYIWLVTTLTASSFIASAETVSFVKLSGAALELHSAAGLRLAALKYVQGLPQIAGRLSSRARRSVSNQAAPRN